MDGYWRRPVAAAAFPAALEDEEPMSQTITVICDRDVCGTMINYDFLTSWRNLGKITRNHVQVWIRLACFTAFLFTVIEQGFPLTRYMSRSITSRCSNFDAPYSDRTPLWKALLMRSPSGCCILTLSPDLEAQVINSPQVQTLPGGLFQSVEHMLQGGHDTGFGLHTNILLR